MGTKKVKRPAKPEPVKRLFARSGNICAFRGCGCILYGDDGTSEGQICHIEGLKKGSARHNPDQSKKKRNAYENMIALCKKHHKEVDDDPEKYTVAYLKEMKQEHEERVAALLEELSTGKAKS